MKVGVLTFLLQLSNVSKHKYEPIGPEKLHQVPPKRRNKVVEPPGGPAQVRARGRMQVPRTREAKSVVHHPQKPEILGKRNIPIEHQNRSGEADNDDGTERNLPHHHRHSECEGYDDALEGDMEEPHSALRIGATHKGIDVVPVTVLGEAKRGRHGEIESKYVSNEEDFETITGA